MNILSSNPQDTTVPNRLTTGSDKKNANDIKHNDGEKKDIKPPRAEIKPNRQEDKEITNTANNRKKKPIIIDGKTFLDSEYQEMVQRRKNGERIVDIAQEKGISRKCLTDKFDQQKVRVEYEKPKENHKIGGKLFSIKEVEDIIKRRQSGQTIPDIAKEKGISNPALTFFLKTNEINT